MIRVAIVASSPVFRAGLEALLAPATIIVGAIAEARPEERVTLQEIVAPLAPDVVVWVPDDPGDDDADWLSSLRGDDALPPAERGNRSATGPSVVVLASVSTGAGVAALRAGARAVVSREAGADQIVAAIEGAAAGLVVLPADIADELLATHDELMPARLPAPTSAAPLTAREREVLALLALGLANKAIAPRLGISEHTVKAHVASIFEKLHVGTRAEAVVAGARSGLLLL
jgi:DNA-binding NarL/FixJ family response regulator